MSDDAPQRERDSAAYVRLPWPAVAAGLFVLLAVALSLGLYANRVLRSAPQAVVSSTSTAGQNTPLALSQATPTAAPTQIPTNIAAVATVLAGPDVRPPTTVATPTSVPTATGSFTQFSATARPTVEPDLAAEVSDAYQQYWDVRSQALYELDGSRLGDVMAGDHLAAAEELIAQLRSEGRAIETDVHHQYAVLDATTTSATVADTYVDESILVDLQSHAAISAPTGQRLNELYRMMKIDGKWRVVDLVRSP